MTLFFSLVFAVVAAVAGLATPESMRLIVPVSSGVSVNDVAIPVGHWALAGLWTFVVCWLHPASRRELIFRCIGVGFALHALLLVALFIPRLTDRAAFSATIYLVYAYLFCGAVIAIATAWSWSWATRMRLTRDALTSIEAPIVIGWAAVVFAAFRYSVVLGIAGLAAGFALAVAVQALRSDAGRRAIASVLPTRIDERVFIAAVFIAALAMRLLYVRRIMSDPNYLDAGADGRIYDQLAWSIATGQGIPEWFSERFPLLLLGHVWLAAGLYSIVGHSYFALTALQSVLGAAACVLLYFIARRLFDRPTAMVAAVFAALSFPLVFAAATIGHQAIDVFVTALNIWLLTYLVATPGPAWRWALAGAIVAFAFTVRETNIFFAAFLLAWIVYAHRDDWRRAVRPLAAFSIGAVLVILPFMAPKLSSPAARQGMRGHFDRMYRGLGGSRPTQRTELVGPLDQPGEALAQLQAEPGRVIGTLTREYVDNFAAQFLTQPYGGFDLVFLRKGSDYYYGMWFYAYVLTIAGTIIVIGGLRAGGIFASGAVLILGLIVSRTIPHLILASDYRHRAPLEPFLILLASVAAARFAAQALTSAQPDVANSTSLGSRGR